MKQRQVKLQLIQEDDGGEGSSLSASLSSNLPASTGLKLHHVVFICRSRESSLSLSLTGEVLCCSRLGDEQTLVRDSI